MRHYFSISTKNEAHNDVQVIRYFSGVFYSTYAVHLIDKQF